MRKYKHKAVPNPDGWGFRVEYPDKVLSADFYNLTWAKHHANVLTETARRNDYRRVSTEAGTGSTLISEVQEVSNYHHA